MIDIICTCKDALMNDKPHYRINVRKIVAFCKFFAVLVLMYTGFWLWQKMDLIVIPTDHFQMSPSFQPKNFHQGNRLHSWTDLKYGDVVYYDYYYPAKVSRREILNFARVIGLPGDTIELIKGHVFRNGKMLREEYISSKHQIHDSQPELIVPRDYVYLMVDNRNSSLKENYYRDSRLWGPILIQTVLGKIEKK